MIGREWSRSWEATGSSAAALPRLARALRRELPSPRRRTQREIGHNFAYRVGTDFYPCLLEDRDALRRAIDGSFLVIHAAGPFQGVDYYVAEECLKAGAHYLDLADAREFVVGIGRLDEDARRRGLMVAAGVSSTPAITSAMIAELAASRLRADRGNPYRGTYRKSRTRRRGLDRRRLELPGTKDQGLSRRPMGAAAGLG